MNLHMVRPKKGTEDLILSINKSFETLIKQTHTKPQETLEFKLTQSRETFSLKQTISIEGCCKIGLTSLEVYKSIFNITEPNNNFQLYTDNLDEFSFTE